MEDRLFAPRFALAVAATFLLPLTAQASGRAPGRYSKLDRVLREAAASPSPGPQRVIIQTRSAAERSALKKALLAHGDVVEAEHPSLNALTAVVHGEDLGVLAADPTAAVVSSDSAVSVTGVTPVKKTNAATARQEARGVQQLFQNGRALPASLRETLGADRVAYTGAGIGVAIIDSGIDPNRDLADSISGFWDFTRGSSAPVAAYDDYGHGTHVAGLIASSGRLSQGEFRGVAPGVRLFGLKVLDAQGRGRSSDVLRAIDFVIANRNTKGIDVINLSLGHPILEPAATDPLVLAIERAVRAGLVVVVAAGNVGTDATGNAGYSGVLSPGNAPSAITVGAVDTRNTAFHGDDRIAWFSSRGPTWYDGFAKPDVVAPGVGLVSDAARSSSLLNVFPQLGVTRNGKRFAMLSGTSMAAAVATGVASLTIEASRVAHPGGYPTPNTVKAMLQYSALPVLANRKFDEVDSLSQGTGELNAIGAVQLAEAINPRAPLNERWAQFFVPETSIGSVVEPWSQELIWGSELVSNPSVIVTHSAIFENIVWGTLRADLNNIVWGTVADFDNIVWGTNVVWASHLVWGDSTIGMRVDGENIVWGTLRGDEFDNIVWGTMRLDSENIVWGTLRDAENIVWGTLRGDEFDNIVSGTALSASGGAENIVWGTLRDTENIVWGTLRDSENIVWGTVRDAENIVWGTFTTTTTTATTGGR
jgi:serine protease AprX